MERDIVTFTTRKDRILEGNACLPLLMPETFEKARRVAPGWDIYSLERLWWDWTGGKEEPKTQMPLLSPSAAKSIGGKEGLERNGSTRAQEPPEATGDENGRGSPKKGGTTHPL
jgi:hypothetical protein